VEKSEVLALKKIEKKANGTGAITVAMGD